MNFERKLVTSVLISSFVLVSCEGSRSKKTSHHSDNSSQDKKEVAVVTKPSKQNVDKRLSEFFAGTNHYQNTPLAVIKELPALNLSHEDLTDLPEEMKALNKVKMINLKGSMIQKVPEVLFEMPQLTLVNMADTDLDEMTAETVAKINRSNIKTIYLPSQEYQEDNLEMLAELDEGIVIHVEGVKDELRELAGDLVQYTQGFSLEQLPGMTLQFIKDHKGKIIGITALTAGLATTYFFGKKACQSARYYIDSLLGKVSGASNAFWGAYHYLKSYAWSAYKMVL